MQNNILDLIQTVIAERGVILNDEWEIQNQLQEIASEMTEGLGFTYCKVVYLRPAIQSKLLSFNQLYAQCLILRIKEIQAQHTDEEISLIKELFFLLPAGIEMVVINNLSYVRCGKKTNTKGRILQEEEILSNIIDD